MQGDFRIEGWRVQPQLNQLVGPAGPVKVQPRSMAVLVLLAGQPGEVLSRQTLLEAAWEGAFVTEEVLTSCIWDLRRALGDDPQAPRFIQTIPRRGYRLIAPVLPAEEAAAAPPAPEPAPEPPPVPERMPARGPDERNRRVLLDKVAAFWVDEVLARALAAVPALAVARQLEWTAVADPRQGRGALDGLEARPIPAGKGIGEIFDETGRALLILGEPGAGKTVALLELAAAAVARARASAVEPVPVVLHLASWSARRGALADWAVEELGLRYQVPRAVAREWLGRDALLLLLDGLDEVAPASQAACVEAIDRFRDRQGMTAIAVACRSDAHAALPRLRLGGAIRLLPLTPAAIESFLRAASLPAGEGAELERSLALDPALGELVRTPLLLRLLCQSAVAGRGATPATVAEEGGDPAGARRRRLLGAFVERALAGRPEGGEPLYPRAVTERRLSWLAREMLAESQPLFHVERLQPGWLPPAGFRAAYWLLSRLAVAVPIALLAAPVPPADGAGRALYALGGAAVGALAAWIAARAARSGGRAVGAVPALALGLAAGLLFYALSLPRLGLPMAQRPGVYFGLVFGVLFGLRRDRHGPAGDIAATEGLGWSWRRTARGAGGGLLLGLLARGALALTGAPPGAGPGGGRGVPLLGLGLFFAAALGVLFGFEGRKVEATSRPNRGIHLALRNALLGGALFGGVCAALETALVGGAAARSPFLPAGAPPPTPSVPFALLGMGLFGFFWFGGLDAIKHYTLRLLLAASGRMPLRLIPFLDFAAARDLLQKAGGGYLFLHRSLLDHFAAEPETLTSPDSR